MNTVERLYYTARVQLLDQAARNRRQALLVARYNPKGFGHYVYKAHEALADADRCRLKQRAAA